MNTISHPNEGSDQLAVAPWVPAQPMWASEVVADIKLRNSDDFVEFRHDVPVTLLPDTILNVFEFVTPDPDEHVRGIYLDGPVSGQYTLGQAISLHVALGKAIDTLTAAGGTIGQMGVRW